MTESKSKKQEKQDRREQLNDVCAVMDTPAGRRFVSRILAQSRVYKTSFAAQNDQTNFNEGMRNVGLWLFDEIEGACPDKILLMMQEHQEKIKEQNHARQRSDTSS